MFTPEYLNELVESTHAAATEYNMYLTRIVIDSIVKQFEYNGKIEIAPSNQHRIRLLKQSGILVSDIEREVRKRLPALDNRIREAFYRAGYDINEEINKSVADMVESDKELKDFVGKAPRLENITLEEKTILDAAYKRTKGEIKNLTQTTAVNMNLQFMQSCDAAWWKVKHGISASTAIREAIDEVSRYGTHVTYKSGRKMTVEAAVRMCVLTGINQANTEITLQLCADTGCRNVLISSHIGARYTDKDEPANHQSWQGKVYSISDELLKKFGYEEKPEEKNIFSKIKQFFQKFRKQKVYPDFETVTGYGTIEGFAGINCRHTMFPFREGMKNNQTQYDEEESNKKYDLYQKQRAMERKIRETKRRLFDKRHAIKAANDEELIAGLKEDEKKLKKLLDDQNSAYMAFCKQNDLQPQYDRIKVADFNREQTKAANTGARRYNKSVTIAKIENNAIINNNRYMANGMRKSPFNNLDDKQIEQINQYAEELNIPRNVLSYNTGYQTGFSDRKKIINIRGDIFPDKTSNNNNRDLLSERAVLAHEYYGHMKHDPSNFDVGDWRDEFRASYSASINAPGLSEEERRMLMIDAYDRAKEAGIPVRYNKKAREIIYGYDKE